MNRKALFFLALSLISSGCAPRYSSYASSTDNSSETNVNGGLNAQKTEADIWRIMPPYFDQEKGGDLAPF
jgi:hypothetical protein